MGIDVSNYQTAIEFFNAFWNGVRYSFATEINLFIYVFVVISFYFLIKGTNMEKKFFGLFSLLIGIFIFNNEIMYFLCSKISGLSNRYFRYLWVFPIGFTIGYFLCAKVLVNNTKKNKVICALLSCLMVIYSFKELTIASQFLFVNMKANPGLLMVDNIYKIEDDSLKCANIIEEDKKDLKKEVNVLFGYYIFMDIRTYDASLISLFNYGELTSYKGGTLNQDAINDLLDNNPRWLLNYLANCEHEDGMMVAESKKLKAALKNNDVDYIIIWSESPGSRLFSNVTKEIGKSDHYTVYKV